MPEVETVRVEVRQQPPTASASLESRRRRKRIPPALALDSRIVKPQGNTGYLLKGDASKNPMQNSIEQSRSASAHTY